MSLINVCIDGHFSQMDESLLDRRDVHDENDNEIVNAVEYWLDGEMVHRSAHIHLKRGLDIGSAAGSIG